MIPSYNSLSYSQSVQNLTVANSARLPANRG
jgi:hypothetical protein